MNNEELFDALDLDHDGTLSGDELHRAAQAYGWHWQQAPFFALMDFLTLREPLGREEFVACMTLIGEDPHGVYGRVLNGRAERVVGSNAPLAVAPLPAGSRVAAPGSIAAVLEEIISEQETCDYASLLERADLARYPLPTGESALLLIDPQRSFTDGTWMTSLGPTGFMEVMPICQAFDNCAQLLRTLPRDLEVMFTRCPFPPDSYGWDARFAGIVADAQPYFIKPSNNVLLPSGNGFRYWLEALLGRGRKRLVLGGCTLNSCVRVSAIETLKHFQSRGLEVIVDLSLCGARTGNYLKSNQFGGISAVAAAVNEMIAGGVTVADSVEWE